MHFVTGNYQVACELYRALLKGSHLNTQHNLWISALANVADAESSLSKDAALGIPAATTSLQGALQYLNCLTPLCQSSGWTFSFQKKLLSLRIDFLDLQTSIRQLIREMRLTGSGPAKRTRSQLHFQNLMKCFDALADRYTMFYRQYGLFICQQSRTALRTAHAVCRFMARTLRVCLFRYCSNIR